MIARFFPMLLKGLIAVLLTLILISGWLVIKTVMQKPEVPRTAAERAIMDGEEAVKADPRSVEARLSVAAAYAGAGRYEDAANHVKIAIRLSPNDAKAHYMLGVIYKDQGKTDLAISTLKKAAELPGELGDVYGNILFELGKAYKQKKDYKNSIEVFKKAEGFGFELYLLHELADSYEKVGQLEEARLAYLNIIYRDIENTEALKKLRQLGVSEEVIEKTRRDGIGAMENQ